MKEQAEERAARDREEKGPDASDPAYLEKMAQRMLSDNFSYSEKALATLLAIDPATASPEAKKQVVLAFKTLAENKRSIQRREAIKGLVKWAGTYSIPALSKMLDNHDSSDDGEIIDALSTFDPATVSPEAKKQVARAFKTLAENRNSFRRREAIKGLVKWAGTYSIPALVKMLDDHDIIVDGEIIKALSAFDPATVSPEAKKQVALAFKMLAEEKYSSEGREAIKGLVKWGGTYSVPVLLKMLNDHNSSNEEEIIKALAELQDTRAVPALVTLLNTGSINEKLILRTLADMKDVRAAPALAAHLRHSYDGSETIARDGLLAMGSGAEDALLALAYTDDFKRCITVLALLGEVGTEKSLETMRRAQSSRDRGVRLTAMNAATKITRRRLELKSRAADKRDP
jgi:HEAT repeat protein